jgi:AraC-like DNA-binding protein
MTRRRAVEILEATYDALLAVPGLQALRIGCSYVAENGKDEWLPVLRDPRRYQLVPFELSFGLERARSEYNAACLAEVRRTKRTYLGQRSGYADFFVPVVAGRTLHAFMVWGPFLTRRPTADGLRREWQAMSGVPADDGDEAFLRYVRAALETHVFEGGALEALRHVLERFAARMVGESPRGGSGWGTIRRLIPESRMWDLAAELVDRDRVSVWSASFKGTDRLHEGFWHMPNHVLAVAPSERSDEDRVDRLVRADALQRGCAALALELQDTAAGRMGDEAAYFVTHVRPEPKERLHGRLALLGERIVRQLRRRLGWEVVCGISRMAQRPAELPGRQHEAMWAVVWGLHNSARVTFYEQAGEPSSAAGLYRSARALCEAFAAGRAKEAVVGAEQVAGDALWISGGSVEAMRSHLLQVSWELVAITDQRHVIDESTTSELLERSSERLGRAGTTAEVSGAFTLLVRELLDVLARPGAAGRKAKLERARRFVEQGPPNEPVSLRAIAKRVGMSAPYLSRCFKKAYGIEFGQFILFARVERAKKLLHETEQKVALVGEQAGFSSPSYFHQAFRRVTGMTPEQYRRTERVVLPAHPPPGTTPP